MNLKELHIELTERCNADCPMCGRTQSGGRPNPNLQGRELSLNNFREFIDPALLAGLTTLRFCGNFGDPVAARDLLEIVRYARLTAPAVSIQIHTNGGLRSESWWYELGRMLSQEKSAVFFGIDGSAETNHLYRRGVQWERLMANVCAYLRSGGRAHWVLLAFAHNEHEIPALREMARALGFAQFTVKASKRFLKTRSLEVEWSHPVLNNQGEKLYSLNPPKHSSLRNAALDSLQEYSGQSLELRLESCTISCRALEPPALFISAEALVFPCCWTAASIYPSYSQQPCGEIWELLLQTGGKQQIDLRRIQLADAVQSRFFQELAERWTRPTFAAGKPKLCARICAQELTLFDSQFQHQMLVESDAAVLNWF